MKICKWNPVGNGHYETECCGAIIYDKGRLRDMQIRVYNDKRPPLPKIEKCPECGEVVRKE